MSRTRAVLENLVIVAIVLVMVHTFLEDFAVLAGWAWSARRVLLFVSLGFDLFFSIEFLTRLYLSFINRRTGVYFWYERGWVDLIASVPLVLLLSGPAALAYFAGSAPLGGVVGLVSILKTAKAIRIARLLRLLRVLKVFAGIRKADSVMAQRHVAKIVTIAVTTVVVGSLLMTVAFSYLEVPSLEGEYQARAVRLLERVSEQAGTPAVLQQSVEEEPSVLVVQRGGRVLYSRHDQAAYAAFGPGDYAFGERDGVRVFFDQRPLNREQSRTNLIYLGIVLLSVVCYLVYYSPHFTLTVSDPVHVMSRGLNEKAYNLEVVIPPLYQGDEVYRLARLYNEVYLPMKERSIGSDDGEVLDLKIEEMPDILG